MNRGVRLFSYRAIVCSCLFGAVSNFLYANLDLELSEAIEATVLATPEVVARQEFYDALVEHGSFGSFAGKPELRVKLEQENLSDDTVFGTAIRWKLDPSNPKWLRAKAYEKELVIAESELRLAIVDSRVRLKRICARVSYLQTSLELAKLELRLQETNLKDAETLLESGATDRWALFRANRECERSRDEVERLEEEIEVECAKLSSSGMPAPSAADSGFESIWSVADVGSLSDLEGTLPASLILGARRSFDADRSLAEKKDAKGVRLSYVQLEAEQEDAWDRDESDSRLGISFGIELPWGNRKKLKALELKAKEDFADYQDDLSRERIQLADTYEVFCEVRERNERMQLMTEGFLKEIRLLSESFALESNATEKARLLEIQVEELRLLRERSNLRYEFLEAALELESRACTEIVLF